MLTVLLISFTQIGGGVEGSLFVISGSGSAFLTSKFSQTPSKYFQIDAGYTRHYTASAFVPGSDYSAQGGMFKITHHWQQLGSWCGCVFSGRRGFYIGFESAVLYGGRAGLDEKNEYLLLAGNAGITAPLCVRHWISDTLQTVDIKDFGEFFLEISVGNVDEHFTLTSIGLGFNLWLFKWGSELPNQDQEKHKEDQQ
ncbi:MAG: hypothetical protein ABIN54_06885 [candidate division WOR-3 bacterium]